MAKKKQQKQAPPTVITVTLPEEDGIQRSGTLLIARGELAHLRQFSYTNLGEIASAIKDAVVALSSVEADPPDINKVTGKASNTTKKDTQAADTPSEDEEPTIDVPLKQGTKAVKISHLKIVGGETDAAAYKQAAIIAGRLIDGQLWDGESPIRFDDVYAVAKKVQHLTDKDFSLFALDDFVQTGAVEAPAETEPTQES